MADFNLDRIRFKWRAGWVSGTVYTKDDVLYYRGRIYVCLTGHTAGADIRDDFSKWELMFDGQEWRGEWQTGTDYGIGNLVKYNGYIYRCTSNHTSVVLANLGLPNDIANWTLLATTGDWKNTWTENTNYNLGDIIKYNGNIYICIEKHLSSTTSIGLEIDQLKWNTIVTSDNWALDWDINVRYRASDIVRYGGIIYRCIEGHTSASSPVVGLENDQVKWETVINGVDYVGEWIITTKYKVNDVVKKDSLLYICVSNHVSSDFTSEQANWQVWIPGLGYEELWNNETVYDKGDLVLYGGYTYAALQRNVNTTPYTDGLIQDSGNWELVTTGYNHRGEWDASIEYVTGDVIRHGGYLYVALTDSTTNYPDTEDTDWQIVVPGFKFRAEWNDNTTYYPGDIVTYLGTAYTCILRHVSTDSDARPDLDLLQPDQDYWEYISRGSANNVLAEVGDLRTYNTLITRLPIGSAGQVAKVVNDLPTFTDYGVISNIFFVGLNGSDDPAFGTTDNAPFRTIKYAAEYIKDNLGINKINVQKYNYDDGTIFDGLSVALQRNFAQTLAATAPNLDAAFEVINPRTSNPYGDIDGNGNIGIFDAVDIGQGVLSTAALTEEQALSFRELIDYLNSRADDFVGETISINNYANGSVPVTIATYPNTTINVKTGLFEEQTPISLPRNCALVGDELRSTVVQPAAGYETANMFYVNNGSGIRNMTLQGITGTLPDVLNQFGTKRPSGGAYVSLDPGNNPADESVWIISKSPYIQNVTTFGTGCIGLLVDGALHEGGNGSIVANDFTQVLDDGIGAYVRNGGLSELVSVFTYFNYIGYLAETGGKIRGTNGNNSYGTYGSVSEGVTQGETPITATIDNQTEQAEIGIVHNNGDEIMGIAYSNAGESYTSATITVSGSGANANLTMNDFRDGAVSRVRIAAPGDSSIPGGLNYTSVQGEAQTGDTTSITLDVGDVETDPANYQGLFIFINSGAGVGQYGVIDTYNTSTKVATIVKHSDGTAGWDRLDTNYPIASALNLTTRYTIETRIVFDAPTSGTRAWGRAVIEGTRIKGINIYDPGSGYDTVPSITVTDNQVTTEATFTVFVNDGVLGIPTFANRGTGYVRSSATISGDGFGEKYQTGNIIKLKDLSRLPGPGDNVEITGIDDVIYKLTRVESSSGSEPNLDATIRIYPTLGVEESPDHNVAVTIRQDYSQVRLTGHDFLDIGSGNVNSTRYPDLYTDGVDSENAPQQQNEVVETGGGRVFYTSTDQDGNFRAGELFKVEQSTGIVSVDASQFDLTGLTEISLGGIQVGGSAVVIREFSKDGTFTANSNNIIPTQQAIIEYLNSRISGGSSNATTNKLTAGQITIQNNELGSNGTKINIAEKVNFTGGVSGDLAAMGLFRHRSNR